MSLTLIYMMCPRSTGVMDSSFLISLISWGVFLAVAGFSLAVALGISILITMNETGLLRWLIERKQGALSSLDELGIIRDERGSPPPTPKAKD